MELLALGPRASTLDMLLLGDAPALDGAGRPVLACVRGAIGQRVPLLQLQVAKGAPAAPDGGAAAASPKFFSDLCAAVLSFLAAAGLEAPRPRLAWGAYVFEPAGRTVSFDGRVVALDPVAFDIALELFFRAGQVVNKRTLRLMLPSRAPAAEQHRIDNIGSLIKELRSCLRLRNLHGWQLETVSHVGYRLLPT